MEDLPDQDISLIEVRNEKDLERYNVDGLATELTGKPVQRIFPIFIVFHRGEVKGYFQAIQQTCIYPAIHPEVMGAKEYIKIMSSLITEIKRAVGNPIFMVCNRADKMSAAALKMMRVKKAEENAYVYSEE